MKPLLLSETSDNYDTRESARNRHRVSNFPKVLVLYLERP
jgi:hypothetical protein